MLEIFLFFQKLINLYCKTQHAVITHANTSNGIKIPTFFWKKVGDDVILVQCPFKIPFPIKTFHLQLLCNSFECQLHTNHE